MARQDYAFGLATDILDALKAYDERKRRAEGQFGDCAGVAYERATGPSWDRRTAGAITDLRALAEATAFALRAED